MRFRVALACICLLLAATTSVAAGKAKPRRVPFPVDLLLEAPATDRPAQVVDRSERYVFGLKWVQPVVHTGFFRTVNVSFGKPALSVLHRLVVVGTGEGFVRAYSLSDGSLQWEYNQGERFEGAASLFTVPSAPPEALSAAEGANDAAPKAVSTPARPGSEVVVIGSREGNVIALEVASGRLLWQAQVGGDVRAPSIQAGSRVVLSTTLNRVHVLDLATGSLIWAGGRSAPSGLTITGHASPLVVDDKVYCSFSDGFVEAYNLDDGARLWSRPLAVRGKEFSDADADPVMIDGRLFVASYSDGIFALDPADGSILWSRQASAVKSLAVDSGRLIAGSGDGWVWGLDASDGSIIFRTHVERGLVSRIEVADGLVLFSAGDSGLVVLGASDGRPLQASGYQTRMHGDPVLVAGEVAVLSANGYLFAFSSDSAGLVR